MPANGDGGVAVIGEALIDLVPGDSAGEFRARTGGSPFNVAVGLARLGQPTSLMARLADNAFGRLLRAHARAEGIDVSRAPLATEPTTLAVVSLDSDAQATYDFYLEGTADWQWTDQEMDQLPTDSGVVHFGSLASWTLPGSDPIATAIDGLRAHSETIISYDPNVRPVLLRTPEHARPVVEGSVRRAHLVKASREDIEWLYPGRGIETVAASWIELGALLVVITDGGEGALGFQAAASGPLHRPGRQVELVDTVGAGDAFTSGLLDALLRRGIRTPQRLAALSADELSAAIDDAILVSSLTCSRLGADPPMARPRPDALVATPLAEGDLRFMS
jgi:fructokinase